jgi:hypothetical protein
MARKPFRPKIAQLKLRLPEALRGHLERVAARNGQSMNAEILQRLQNSFRADAMQQKDIHTRMAETLLEGLDQAIVDKMEDIIQQARADDAAADAAEDHFWEKEMEK